MVILEMEELAKVSLVISIYLYSFKKMLDGVYYTHFEITGGPCNLIGSNWCDLFTNRTIFCFKSHLFPSQWGGYTKNKTANQIWRLAQSNRSHCRKMKDKVVSCGKFCNFCWQFANSYFFHPKKWMNLISNRLSTASIKYLNWPSPVFEQFQNGCNVLVISNRTSTAPKLHFTQFNYHYKSV